MSAGPDDARPADGSKRVCLFTGAAGQLGSAFLGAYADQYHIAAVYRRTRPWFSSQDARILDPLDPTADLEENHHPVFTIQADLTADDACARVVEATLSRFDRIDLLVNAAVSSTWAPMLGSDHLARSASQQFVTNVLAPLQLSLAVARAFWQGRDEENRRYNRDVVNVSSVAGLRLYRGAGQSIYAASKAALNHLTSHMADEFTSLGVRVNAVAPNSFPSIVPTARAAAAVKNLDEGSTTGTVVVVDGDEDRTLTLPPYVPGSAEGFVP